MNSQVVHIKMAIFECDVCTAQFSRLSNKNRHMERAHNHVEPVYECSLCSMYYTSYQKLLNHRRLHKPSTGFKFLRSAFKRQCVIHRKVYEKRIDSFEEAFSNDRDDLFTQLNYERARRTNVKVSLIYNVEFVKLNGGQQLEEIYEIRLRTPSWTIRSVTDVQDFLKEAQTYIGGRIEDFVSRGSGWVLDEVLYADLEMGACYALTGGCNKLAIKFRKELHKITPCKPRKNEQDCFFQSIAYHFIKKNSKGKLRHFIKKHINVNISMPVCVDDIPKFEKMNAHLNLKINVLASEGARGKERIFPIYTSRSKSTENIINLVLWKTKMGGKLMSHFSYIEDLTKFLRKNYEKGYTRTYERAFFVVIACLNTAHWVG